MPTNDPSKIYWTLSGDDAIWLAQLIDQRMHVVLSEEKGPDGSFRGSAAAAIEIARARRLSNEIHKLHRDRFASLRSNF